MRFASTFRLVLGTVGLLLTSASAGQAANEPSTSSTIELQGRCEYVDRVAGYLDGSNGFALCDAIAIVQDGKRATFDFRQRSWGSTVRYEGDSSSDAMAITHIEVRNRPAEAARGDCKIYRQRGQISKVTCIATARRLTWAANFVPRP